MPNLIDLRGKKFNRWTVIRKGATRDKYGDVKWLCRCDCGTEREVVSSGLRKGSSKSCGCYKAEVNEQQGKLIGAFGKIHGMEGTRIYRIHHGMKSRCDNKNVREYPQYGGRGITYCESWHNFIPFMEWALANGYEDHLQIDRIENDGNYEPSNCRWATGKQNCNNRRSNALLTIDGVTKTQSQWAEENGMFPQTIRQRIKKGWTGRDLIKPIRRNG